MSTTEKEIELFREDNITRFYLDEDLNYALEHPDEPRTFICDFLPNYGLLAAKNGHAMLPGVLFKIFNPNSIPGLENCRVGDLVLMKTTNQHEQYRLWNPSAENDPGIHYEQLFRVVDLNMDPLNYPVLALVTAM